MTVAIFWREWQKRRVKMLSKIPSDKFLISSEEPKLCHSKTFYVVLFSASLPLNTDDVASIMDKMYQLNGWEKMRIIIMVYEDTLKRKMSVNTIGIRQKGSAIDFQWLNQYDISNGVNNWKKMTKFIFVGKWHIDMACFACKIYRTQFYSEGQRTLKIKIIYSKNRIIFKVWNTKKDKKHWKTFLNQFNRRFIFIQ